MVFAPPRHAECQPVSCPRLFSTTESTFSTFGNNLSSRGCVASARKVCRTLNSRVLVSVDPAPVSDICTNFHSRSTADRPGSNHSTSSHHASPRHSGPSLDRGEQGRRPKNSKQYRVRPFDISGSATNCPGSEGERSFIAATAPWSTRCHAIWPGLGRQGMVPGESVLLHVRDAL